MALRKTGLEFQAKGYRQFIRSTEAVNKATERVEATFARISKMRVQLGDMRSTLAELRGKSVKDLVPKEATDRLSTFTRGIGELTGRLGFLPPQVQAAVGGLSQLTGALGGAVGKMSLATVGAVALGAALLGLGMRGAAMPGVIEAFDVATQRAGVYSQTLLGDLRAASRGTIADMQLMRTANVALAGASEGLAQELGKGGGLAGLLEVARAQARATGQDVGFLFDSLVSGVKRSSPMLIDNTGLVLKVGEANQRFAESIGKSVDALTAEEKQIALLNATLEAGRLAVETYGQGALQAAERIAIIRTTITNTLDKLAVAIQPLFNYILAIGQTFISAVVWPLQNLVIPVIYEVANALFGPMTRAWERTTGIISDVFQPVAQLIHRWLVVLVGAIRGFGMAWDWLLQQVTKVLGPIGGILKKYLVEPVSKALDPVEFARRAGYAFGALAQGILWAFNTYIAPAVIFIAEFIADFLMGFSPPKRGPLSKIDEGGANVMRAWLQGFMGVSLQPVKEVTAAVNAELGKIGTFTHNQVEKRVAQLDAALQPFIDRLDIAKAKMEALIEPLRGVQDALQKKLARQLERFTKGEVDAEAVRALDRQNAALSERIQTAEDMTVEAEYQLALKKSEQAVERALLAIQARRVKKTEDAAAATAKVSTAAGKVAEETEQAARKGGGAADEETSVGGGTLPSLGGDPIGDWLGVSSEEVDQMWGEISTAFADGFDDIAGDDLAKAKENWGKLQKQIGRIGDSKPFQVLQDAVDSIFGSGEDSLRGKISSFATDVGDTLGGLADKVEGPVNRIAGAFNKIDPDLLNSVGLALGVIAAPHIVSGIGSLGATALRAGLGLASMAITGGSTAFSTLVSGVTTLAASGVRLLTLVPPLALIAGVAYAIQKNFGGIQDAMNQVAQGIREGDFKKTLDGILDTVAAIPLGIAEWVGEKLGIDVPEGLKAWEGVLDNIKVIIDALPGFVREKIGEVWKYIGDAHNYDSLRNRLSRVPGNVVQWLSELGGKVKEALYDPFKQKLTDIWNAIANRTEGDSLATRLFSLPLLLGGWLLDLGIGIYNSLVQPFINKVKEIWDNLAGDGPDSLKSRLLNLPNEIIDALSDLETKLKEALFQPFEKVINDVLNKIGEIGGQILGLLGLGGGGGEDTVVHPQTGEPVVPQLGARGGKPKAGELWVVGERGWEFFRPDVPGTIIPHRKSVDMLRQMSPARTVPTGGSTSNVTTNNSTVLTVNFNGGDNRQNLRMRLSEARALL